MPVTGIRWSNVRSRGRDVHLLPGQPRDLSHQLIIDFTKANGDKDWKYADDYLANHNDVVLVFQPMFKTQGAQPANTHKGHGISVDTLNGVITLDATLPSPRKNNFMMEVEANDSATGDHIDSTSIRIHVHQAITNVWLTPDTLTVRPFKTSRPEHTDYKFSLRAEFDDHTVGNITNMPNLSWSPAANVDGSDGELILKAGDDPGDTLTISVTLPAAIGGASTSATMLVGDAWDPANPIDVSIVVGGGWPGTINPEKVPNVLLLGDGFTNANRAAFDQYVNSLIQFLKVNPLNKPYDVLSTSINFWTAFTPSQEIGISVGAEIYPVVDSDSGDLHARYIRGPKKPPSGHTGNYNLAQLIYMVGLPISTDDKSNAGRSNNTIKTEWQQLVDTDPTPHVDDDLINSWRKLAKRSLIDERDSFFGVRAGDTISDPGDIKDIDLNESRITRNDKHYDPLDSFLSSLRDPRGISVSDLWAKTPPPDEVRPANYDLVCILVAGKGRAKNSDGYFFVDIFDNLKIAKNATNSGYHLEYE